MPEDELRAPSVTVAMVTYNSEAYVAEAIESVLRQDLTDFELLICDDASTDRTWSIIARFTDRRIRAIRNAMNLGEYPNRNQAIAGARGRYLYFLDGDDYAYPHGVGFMARALDRFPRAGFASAQPPSEKFIYPVELTPHEFYSCQFLGPNVTGANFTQLMFRTQSLRAAGAFDPRFRTGDTHIQFRIGMRENCVLIADGLAWWRRYPGQASEAILQDLWGLAEFTRYGREALDDPHCPLTSAERKLARANLCRLFLRNVARFARRGRIVHAGRLLRHAGIRPDELHYYFAQNRRPYLQDVDSSASMRATTFPPRVREPDSVSHQRR